jgi:hypothetical protein
MSWLGKWLSVSLIFHESSQRIKECKVLTGGTTLKTDDVTVWEE